MTPFRLLVAALYVQVLLGLVRFVAPYLGFWLDERVWLIHPLNGIAIAAAALVLFRPRPDLPGARVRRAARFAPLLPLALGLGMAVVQGAVGALGAVALHMVAGLAAVRIMGTAMAEQEAPPVSRSTPGTLKREERA
jgi:hypothetical protein